MAFVEVLSPPAIPASTSAISVAYPHINFLARCSERTFVLVLDIPFDRLDEDVGEDMCAQLCRESMETVCEGRMDGPDAIVELMLLLRSQNSTFSRLDQVGTRDIRG